MDSGSNSTLKSDLRVNLKTNNKGGFIYHENDISAKEQAKIKGSWIQKKNEFSRWKKGFSRKEIKRKKEIICIDRF